MTTQMVRKQIYLQPRQAILLKRLAQARGVSEAEVIRQAIEREAVNTPMNPMTGDRSAWLEMVAFLEQRRANATGGQSYHLNREEIYAERKDR